MCSEQLEGLHTIMIAAQHPCGCGISLPYPTTLLWPQLQTAYQVQNGKKKVLWSPSTHPLVCVLSCFDWGEEQGLSNTRDVQLSTSPLTSASTKHKALLTSASSAVPAAPSPQANPNQPRTRLQPDANRPWWFVGLQSSHVKSMHNRMVW